MCFWVDTSGISIVGVESHHPLMSGVYSWKSEDIGYWSWCGRWFGPGRSASDHGLDTHGFSDVVVENIVLHK
jgi:hypothetical protein